jgi:hypothetical protein
MQYSNKHRNNGGLLVLPTILDNNPAYDLIKPQTHKANVLDPKSKNKKEQELGSCFGMQVQAYGLGEAPPGYELNLNLNLRNYLI